MVAGGWDGREYLRSTDLYDTAEEKWETAGEMEIGRENACAVRVGNDIWMMGGEDGGPVNGGEGALSSCEIFSTEQFLWHTGPDMKRKRLSASATVLNFRRMIFVAGVASSRESVESSIEYCKPIENENFGALWQSYSPEKK